jgi:peptidoglycan/LPS O-acetylase OafA/YrhL
MRYILLDQVRGISALLVFFHHGSFLGTQVDYGSIGVDLFFFLSAFLLTYGFFANICQLKQRKFKGTVKVVAKYGVRRILRVYPLFLLLVLVLKLGPQELRNSYYMPIELDFWRTALMLEKYRYFVFWTLPVELSYYLLIPLVVMIICLSKGYWWVTNGIILVASIYPSLYWYRSPYLNLDAHIGTFLAGSAFGICYHYIKSMRLSFIANFIAELIASASFVVLCGQVSKSLLYPVLHIPSRGTYPYLSAFMGMVIIKELKSPGWISRFLSWDFLKFTGEISFSMYLLHPIGLYYTRHSMGNDRFLWAVLYTYGLSILSYYVIESPIRYCANKSCEWIDSWFLPKVFPEESYIFQI